MNTRFINRWTIWNAVLQIPLMIRARREWGVTYADWQGSLCNLVLVRNLRNYMRFGPPGSSMTLVDVGAHNSEFSRVFVKAFSECEWDVVSFEPNVNCNPIGVVYRLALWNETCHGKLSSRVGPSEMARFEPCEAREAFAVRYDLVVPILRPNAFLKIDVEGGECEVIDGLGEQIRQFSHILVEVSRANLSTVIRMKQLSRYTAVCISASQDNVNRAPDTLDILFTRFID